MNRMLTLARSHRVLVVVVVAVVAFLPAILWYQSQVNPGGSSGAPVVLNVPAGSGAGVAVSGLASQGVISGTLAFRIYLTLHGTPLIQPGHYLFYRHESFGAIDATLAGGANVFPVSIPPGYTVAELSQEMGDVPGHNSAAFLSEISSGAVRSPWEPPGVNNLDGLLAPGSYLVKPGESDAAVLQQMIGKFNDEAQAAGLVVGAQASGLTPYQAIIVAAIVQKEGVYPQNLGKVSRVIYNRLNVGMPLQMDSTVLYALGQDGGPVGNAESHQSPYNTYLNKGLPPTPTSFPSADSLAAALHPTPGSWLYFVLVQSDGTEAFSNTNAGQIANEHLAASRGLG